MPRKKIYEDVKYQQEFDIAQWPTVLIDNIAESDRELYLLRKQAVDMYLNNTPIQEIIDATGFHRNITRKLVQRCLELDQFGNPYGYTALIPYKRIKKYTRKDEVISEGNSNYSGAFSQLLEKYPELKEFICSQYLGMSKKHIIEPNIRPKVLHGKFMAKCRKLGIQEDQYPFNTQDKGKRSLYRYTDSLKTLYYSKYTQRYGDAALQTLKSTGIGQQNAPIITRPFQQVQFDGHKIDAMIAIKFKTLEGDIVVKPMSRIWLLAIIDVATRVILGYHLCLNTEYSSADVLKCIENAIKPKEKITFTIPRLTYPENGGFHSLCIADAEWALWDEFLYDNAKANLAKNVTQKLTQVVKCSVNAGPVATPERRGLVERFFKTLEERGYHRLVSTVGNGPKDPRRRNSEQHAVKYEISESEIGELTEVLIANYNNTPHDGINGFTPLEVMKQRIERGQIPRTMPEHERTDITFLSLTIERKVAGDIKKGRRPYIHYEGVDYRNDILARMPDLIGTKLTLLININDLRMIKAYLPDGSEFGILTAKGKWALKPHTLKMRQEINKLKRNKEIHLSMYDDPIEVYHQYLTSKATESKPVRNKLAKLNKIQEQLGDKTTTSTKTPTVNFEKEQFNPNHLTNSDANKIKDLKKSNMFKTLNL